MCEQRVLLDWTFLVEVPDCNEDGGGVPDDELGQGDGSCFEVSGCGVSEDGPGL